MLLLVWVLWILTNSFFIFNRIPSTLQLVEKEYQTLTPISPNFYEIEVYASQWQYEIIDIAKWNLVISEGKEEDEGSLQQLREDLLYRAPNPKIAFEKGSTIKIHFFSRDVQHGLQVESLDFNIVSKRPGQGYIYSSPVVDSIVFPSEKGIFHSSTSILTGLGDAYMVITFYNGEPEIIEFSEVGWLLAFGLLNLVFVSLFLYYWKRADRIQEKSIETYPEH